MLAVILAIGLAGAVAVFANPTLGLSAFWFISWMYPTALLYGKLPGSVRLDDLLLVWVTICAARRMPPDVLSSRSFRMAALWALSITLGGTVGLMTSPPFMYFVCFKEILKGLYVPMIVLSFNSLIRNERDLRRQLMFIGLAAIGSITIGIIQVYAPALVAMWEVPETDFFRLNVSEMDAEGAEETRRAGGSIGVVFMAVLGMTMGLLGLRLAVHVESLSRKLAYGVLSMIGVVGLGYTATRGATAGLAAALLYCILFMQKRAATLLLVVASMGFALTQTDVGDRLLNRILGRKGQAYFADSVDTRTRLWVKYLTEWSPHYFLFGRGMSGEQLRHMATVHSSYIGALAYTGLFGCGVMAYLVFMCFRLSWRLQNVEADPHFLSIAETLGAVTLGMLVNGLTAELWQQPQVSLFALIALVDWRLRQHERGDVGPFAVMQQTAIELPPWRVRPARPQRMRPQRIPPPRRSAPARPGL